MVHRRWQSQNPTSIRLCFCCCCRCCWWRRHSGICLLKWMRQIVSFNPVRTIKFSARDCLRLFSHESAVSDCCEEHNKQICRLPEWFLKCFQFIYTFKPLSPTSRAIQLRWVCEFDVRRMSCLMFGALIACIILLVVCRILYITLTVLLHGKHMYRLCGECVFW